MSEEPKLERIFTQKDIEVERGHAQHFKQELEAVQNRYKGIDPERYAAMQAELDALKNDKVAKGGDPKELEARIA